MKKVTFLITLFVTTLFFFSCANFMKGDDVKNQLDEEIGFHNGKNASIHFSTKAGSGSIEPVGDYSYHLGSSEVVSFTPSQKYSFCRWAAYDEDGNTIDDDIIHFENPDNISTKVTFIKSCKDVTIQPVVYLTSVPFNYDPKDLTFEINFKTDDGTLICFDPSGIERLKKYKSLADYKKIIASKSFTFNATIHTLNNYKSIFLAYSETERIAEKLLGENKNGEFYASITVNAKDITDKKIYFFLEDFYGNIIKIEEKSEDRSFIPKNTFEKSPIINTTKVALKLIEPYQFQLINTWNYKHDESRFYVYSDAVSFDKENPDPKFAPSDGYEIYSYIQYSNPAIAKFNPETDFKVNGSYNPDKFIFLDNITFEVYGGTSAESLSLLKGIEPQWNPDECLDIITLPENEIDPSKDYYFKTVIKAINGEELSNLWIIKPNAKITKKIYDGSKLYLDITVPDGLSGESWELYSKNSSSLEDKLLNTYQFNKINNTISLDNPMILEDGTRVTLSNNNLYLKLKSDNTFCYSNTLKISLNPVYNSDPLIKTFSVEPGDISSGKYSAAIELNSSNVHYEYVVKYVVMKGEKIIAEFTNNTPSFDISCDDLINVSEEPLKIYSILGSGETRVSEIDYQKITFLNEGKKTTQQDFRKAVADLTPPDCANAQFSADLYNFYITLPEDLISSERNGRNQYIYKTVYWVPFKNEWENIPVNEIPVTEELLQTAKANGDMQNDSGPKKYYDNDFQFNTSIIKRGKLENYNKCLIIMDAEDTEHNRCVLPVFVYETRQDLIKHMNPNLYTEDGSVGVSAIVEGIPQNYYISIPEFGVDEAISYMQQLCSIDLYYTSEAKIAPDDFVKVNIYYKQITDNHGIFDTSQDYYVWNTETRNITYDYLKMENGTFLFYLSENLNAYIKVIKSSIDYGNSLADWERNLYAVEPYEPAIKLTETAIINNFDSFKPDTSEFKDLDYYIVAVYWPDVRSEILYKGRYFKKQY